MSLLSYLLKEYSPIAQYRANAVVGLPQDTFDCSRIIAHSFLGSVDDEFASEGENGAYSRYMDDMVLGASSREGGYRLIGRVQRALETIGLYPNISKTRIIRKHDFARQMMKEENDYLGVVSDLLDGGGRPDIEEFRRRIRRDLVLEDKPRAWERVLRRYYTASRQLRESILLEHISDHMSQFPGSTRQILDYASTFRLTVGRIRKVRDAVDGVADLYQEVHLLAMQYGAIAPTVRSEDVKREAASWGRTTLSTYRDTHPRLAAAAVVLTAKFGSEADWDFLEDVFSSTSRRTGGHLATATHERSSCCGSPTLQPAPSLWSGVG